MYINKHNKNGNDKNPLKKTGNLEIIHRKNRLWYSLSVINQTYGNVCPYRHEFLAFNIIILIKSKKNMI